MDDIERELRSLPPETLAELSNGLDPKENRFSAKMTGLGARIAGKVYSKGFSNSPLATARILSPNCTTPRNHAIDTLTPHHAAGVLSVRALLEWFRTGTKNASCTYGIGSDGTIEQGVDEANRPWTSSSSMNDNRAITFEVCNCGWEKDGWPISDKAFEALVALCTDICTRYGKKRLVYIPDRAKALAYEPKADEMKLTRHEWFANTCCPGPSLGAKFEELARRVTANLNEEEIDMTREQMEKIVDERIEKAIYGNIQDVPDYWRSKIQKLLGLKVIDGGTPDTVNDHDVNLTRTQAKLVAIFVRLIDAVFPGAIDAALERMGKK